MCEKSRDFVRVFYLFLMTDNQKKEKAKIAACYLTNHPEYDMIMHKGR